MKLKNGEELTEKVAHRICLELWQGLAETGEKKDDWIGWEKYGLLFAGCPLCEYYRPSGGDNCRTCPLSDREEAPSVYGCWSYSFSGWFHANTKRPRKKYAKLFLEQLKELI